MSHISLSYHIIYLHCIYYIVIIFIGPKYMLSENKLENPGIGLFVILRPPITFGAHVDDRRRADEESHTRGGSRTD